ncbi:MAG: hypothetical protein NTU85_03440 [Candidatus Kaiserbacteria bacterium]|nr:hypothetical protein [Candidatus Kaiserbacteria bacterium]
MASGFRWVKPPEAELVPNIVAYGDRVRVAVRAVADYMAQKVQGEMRAGAPWEDRTGNARSGLFSVVEEASRDLVMIWLSHGTTIDYGVFLELAHGKKYAIIVPTMQANIPVIEKMLRDIFG